MIENNSPLDHPPISDEGFKKARRMGILAALTVVILIQILVYTNTGCKSKHQHSKHYNTRNLTNK
jgi:hypothetical protein